MNLIQTINTNKAPQAVGPYSQGIIAGDLVFLSGQIPLNIEINKIISSDIVGQTRQVLKNITILLESVGLTTENIIKANCYLTNMKDFTEFNKEYERFFSTKPSRSCVGVSDLPKGALVEIEVIAVK